MGALERIGEIESSTYDCLTFRELQTERWNAFLLSDTSSIYHVRRAALRKLDAHEEIDADWWSLIYGCTDDITKLINTGN